jgi:hypothetical protein
MDSIMLLALVNDVVQRGKVSKEVTYSHVLMVKSSFAHNL